MDDSTAISTSGPSTPPRRGICWECNGIPSSCFFEPAGSALDYEYNPYSFSGTWNDARKGCALCDSLVAHFGVSNKSGGDGGDSFGSPKGAVHRYFFTVEYGGKTYPHFVVHDNKKMVRFIQSSILRSVPTDLRDMMLAKSWITRCLRSHEEHCGHDESSGFSLKVIDCNSRELCEIVPGTPYICLSYVWGNASANDKIGVDLSRSLPKTIEDSIWVTIQLGYSYLWVDRYCIDQHDAAEKHHLITNMGAIYKSAALTIIAAAGDSPHSGLPGVNGTPRRRHYSHAVGTSSQKIVGLEDPCKEIENSVWGTRGWTYQELVLSRRRLVFTQSQMYFQCKSMHRIESLPSQATASVDGSIPDNSGFHSAFRAFHFMDTSSTAQTLYNQISGYFRRRLSFPEDTIKAVTGIINAFELRQSTHRVGVTHVFGLPILYSQTSPTFQLPSGENYDTTVFTPTSIFAYGLTWVVSREDDERNDTAIGTRFPSWSWANAKASQQSNVFLGIDWMTELVGFSSGKDLQVWLHDKCKGRLELNHYIKTCGQEDDRSLLPMISIRSWVVSCSIKVSEPSYGYLISGFEEQYRCISYCPYDPLSGDMVTIFLGSKLSKDSADDEGLRNVVLLVVEKVNDSVWRRIGVFKCMYEVSQGEDTLTWLNRLRPEGSWEMRTLCLV